MTTSNNQQMRDLDQKLASIMQVKRMAAGKVLTLNGQLLTRLDNHEKFLKYLKKQNKDQKISEVEVSTYCRGVFDDIEQLVKNCYFNFRLERTDFQALFLKLKFNQQSKSKSKINLQQIISLQTKKQSDILLKCNDSLLIELRNDIQDFQLNALITKSSMILSGLPSTATLTELQKKSIKPIIVQICRNYHILPFHNFTHGFGVFMSFYSLARTEGIKSMIQQNELMFCLLACLAHDVQHEGYNTLFQVKTNSEISVVFGKMVVMEKMHLAKTLDILIRKEQTNKLFQGLSTKDKDRARKVISKCILATDMSKHYDYVSSITDKTIDQNSPQDKQLVMEALIHACDIENPSLQFKSYMYWAHLICIEFHDQTVKEKELNVEVTDFLKFDSLLYFFKNQSNFANSIVMPLWQSLEKLFPQIQQKQYTKRIKKNSLSLSQALRRNSEPVLVHKPFQQYLINKLEI